MKNASDIELQEEAIRMKKTAIAEYEIVHRMIQEAGIWFGFWFGFFPEETRTHTVQRCNFGIP
jgi:hypothetical protein